VFEDGTGPWRSMSFFLFSKDTDLHMCLATTSALAAGPLSGQQQAQNSLDSYSYCHTYIWTFIKVRAATIQALLQRGNMLNEAHAFLLSSFLFPLSPPPSLKFHLNFLT
jgi:hypothetical protein